MLCSYYQKSCLFQFVDSMNSECITKKGVLILVYVHVIVPYFNNVKYYIEFSDFTVNLFY